MPGNAFNLRYDKLVIAVGAYSQTFNVPGIKEHAHFLKDVRDARAIRTRIIDCFEQANQPVLSDVQCRNLLNFCICMIIFDQHHGPPPAAATTLLQQQPASSACAQHTPTFSGVAKVNADNTLVKEKGRCWGK
ncbi:uncharacterized protein EDB93DRAFT_1250138 [Suillus bovinus]|uniref:uncharacterized protein n=1 Tax=Suillus bovinus TaxID=48563 RepID=UPI001B8615F4|nr:uncharacterized protein EDB93DRAFT_1250138 [Suillus bovinus]KAG2148704.1 hypothetical protein EDB93DRAFT_1250138 [Suillus bovinus]